MKKRQPYELLKLPPEYDRRIKLSEADKRELRLERKTNGTSYNGLARMFGCSKRLAIFICRPETYEVARKDFKERRKDGRYKPTKESWAKTMRQHRAYKKMVLKKLTTT